MNDFCLNVLRIKKSLFFVLSRFEDADFASSIVEDKKRSQIFSS